MTKKKTTLGELTEDDLILAPGAVLLFGFGEQDAVWVEAWEEAGAAAEDVETLCRHLKQWRTQVLSYEGELVVVGRLKLFDELEAVDSPFVKEHAVDGLMLYLWEYVAPSFLGWWDEAVDREVERLVADGPLNAPNNVAKPISARRGDELRELLGAENIVGDKRGELSMGAALLRTLQLGGPSAVEMTINSSPGFGARLDWTLALQRKDRAGERKTDVFVWVRRLVEEG